MYKNYLAFFDPVALLSLGDWPEGEKGNQSMFWHERFHMSVPDELVHLLIPFLRALEKTVADMGRRASISVRSVPVVLRTLAIVVVQDALELAEDFSKHPVHAMLLEDNDFQYVQ